MACVCMFAADNFTKHLFLCSCKELQYLCLGLGSEVQVSTCIVAPELPEQPGPVRVECWVPMVPMELWFIPPLVGAGYLRRRKFAS